MGGGSNGNILTELKETDVKLENFILVVRNLWRANILHMCKYFETAISSFKGMFYLLSSTLFSEKFGLT